jgi:hypothetical protein
MLIEPIQCVAGGNARFASRAGIEVHLKCVLLARPRALERDEIAVVLLLTGQRALVVLLGEALDRRQCALRLEQGRDRQHGQPALLDFRDLAHAGQGSSGDGSGHDGTTRSCISTDRSTVNTIPR